MRAQCLPDCFRALSQFVQGSSPTNHEVWFPQLIPLVQQSTPEQLELLVCTTSHVVAQTLPFCTRTYFELSHHRGHLGTRIRTRTRAHTHTHTQRVHAYKRTHSQTVFSLCIDCTCSSAGRRNGRNEADIRELESST